MTTANDPEDVRVARVRSLFQEWIKRHREKKQPGMADMTDLGFYCWLLKHFPELLPHGKGDPYQLLKSDLKGLI